LVLDYLAELTVAVVLPTLPAIIERVHESGRTVLGWRRFSRAGFAAGPGFARRRDGHKHPGEHDKKPDKADDRLANADSDNEHNYAEYNNEGTDYDTAVIRPAAPRSNRRNEISVVLVEIALHLFQKALFLLGKRHA
jgi:hypothetical protein